MLRSCTTVNDTTIFRRGFNNMKYIKICQFVSLGIKLANDNLYSKTKTSCS